MIGEDNQAAILIIIIIEVVQEVFREDSKSSNITRVEAGIHIIMATDNNKEGHIQGPTIRITKGKIKDKDFLKTSLNNNNNHNKICSKVQT
jgi:hypothetical protein